MEACRMIPVKYEDVVNDELLISSLDHNVFPGFKEDYRCLTCLLRRINPKTVFEVGSNVGSGINVIATALPKAKIYSLDLDYETMKQNSEQYPLDIYGNDRVGSEARFSYTQFRGDSMTFDYSIAYPIEAWFIDGEHDYNHPNHEAKEAIKSGAKLIVFHDADIKEVGCGIVDAFSGNKDYALFRVEDTRIAFALKNEKTL